MITYSSNLCKKVLCNVIGLTIVYFSEAATRGVLLEKSCPWKFRKIQRKTLLIFLAYSLEDLLFISFQEKSEMKKGKYTDGVQIFTFLLEYRFV